MTVLICTCTEWQSPWGHLKECELWEDPDFQDQLMIWDCEKMKLVTPPEGFHIEIPEGGSEYVDKGTGEIISLFDMLLDSLDGKPHPECELAEKELNHDPAECAGCIGAILREQKEVAPPEHEKGCLWNGDWCIYHSKWKSEHTGQAPKEEKVNKEGGWMELDDGKYKEVLEAGADLHIPDESTPYKCSCPWTKDDSCEVCGVFLDMKERWIPTSVRRLIEATMAEKNLVYDCECEPQPKWRCRKCEVQRETTMDPWTYWDPEAFDLDWADDYAWWHKATHGGSGSYSSSGFGKCRHYSFKLEMPDKTVLYPSSHFMRTGKQDEPPEPDLNVMLYSGWKPNKIAMFVDWPDYGLPGVPWTEIKWLINEMYKRAKKGQYIEFGCMGGHGRTGTLLGCMLVQRHKMTTKAAIEWVHKNYCEEAIEGAKQEWYIEYFKCMLEGKEAPPQPVTKTASTTTGSGTCSIKQHYETWLSGKSCIKPCCVKFWPEDKGNFEKNRVPASDYGLRDGGPNAPKPSTKPVQTTMLYDEDGEWSNCLKDDHRALWTAGKVCSEGPQGKPCYWWGVDEEEFRTGAKTDASAVSAID